MKIWVKAQTGFTMVILLILLGAFLAGRDWPFQARLFPWAICIPTLMLCLFQLGFDLFRERKHDTAEEERWIVDLSSKQGFSPSIVLWRVVNIFGWIFGFFFSIWFIGFIITVPLFIWLYLVVQGREKWWAALLCTILAQAFLIGLFHYIIHFPWPEGFINWPQEVILGWIGN